jgi:hypothetical protein
MKTYTVYTTMDDLEIKSATISINLDNPNDIDTKNREQMALDHLREYEGTCFDGGYVVRILSVICGYRECLPRKMWGEATMSVHFEYEAITIHRNDESVIIHNCVVKRVTKEVHLICTSQSHIAASVLIDVPGIIIPGMVVPIRLTNAQFPQNITNKINVQGEVLKPIEYAMTLGVSQPNVGDIDIARVKIEEVDRLATSVAIQKRSQFFRSWLYPHKEIVKFNNLNEELEKKWVKTTYILIDDWCDPTNLEYKKTKGKKSGFDTISFLDFVEFLIDDAKRMWRDIEKLSTTYASEEMFNKHSSLFKYYETAKDAVSDDDDDDDDDIEHDEEYTIDESIVD